MGCKEGGLPTSTQVGNVGGDEGVRATEVVGGSGDPGRGLAEDASGAPTPIQPGTAELTIDVAVVYLIG